MSAIKKSTNKRRTWTRLAIDTGRLLGRRLRAGQRPQKLSSAMMACPLFKTTVDYWAGSYRQGLVVFVQSRGEAICRLRNALSKLVGRCERTETRIFFPRERARREAEPKLPITGSGFPYILKRHDVGPASTMWVRHYRLRPRSISFLLLWC